LHTEVVIGAAAGQQECNTGYQQVDSRTLQESEFGVTALQWIYAFTHVTHWYDPASSDLPVEQVLAPLVA
jgi:hypothetical protein